MDAESSAYHKALLVFSKQSTALIGLASPPAPLLVKGIFIFVLIKLRLLIPFTLN
jgi:hypothetical protein